MNGNRTYRRSEYLNTDNNNLYIGIEEVNEYDENNNLIMSRSNSYDYTTNDFYLLFLETILLKKMDFFLKDYTLISLQISPQEVVTEFIKSLFNNLR